MKRESLLSLLPVALILLMLPVVHRAASANLEPMPDLLPG
jgi:hypothetical protein